MTRRIFLPATALFLSATTHAQNVAPTVDITAVELDQGAQTVSITYTLSDAEQDPCEVLLSASADGGATFLINTIGATGDIGPAVTPGAGRSISWNYGGLEPEGVFIRVMADDGHAPDIQTMVDALQADRLMQRLSHVAIPRHHLSAPAGLSAIRDTLMLAYEAAGIQPTQQAVIFQGNSVPNIIGRLPGLVDEARTFIVDGHYDAVTNTAGADDNATAVAATLEIARILSEYRFRNSIRFIGFSFEEQGLIGAQAYVQSGIPAWEQIAGVLNMEMIGYYSDAPNSQQLPAGFELLFPDAVAAIAANSYRGDFLTVVGNTASGSLIDAYMTATAAHVPELSAISLAVPGNGQIAPDLRRSDHAVFWDTGRQALMLTDGSNFRNANYHTANDTPATIDTLFFLRSTKATLATLATLAEPIHAGFDTYLLGDLVGVHEHHAHTACSATANPDRTADVLRVDLGQCSAERIAASLFDMRGTRVAGRTLRPAHGVHEIPLAGIGNGIYLLVLREGDQHQTLKVEVLR